MQRKKPKRQPRRTRGKFLGFWLDEQTNADLRALCAESGADLQTALELLARELARNPDLLAKLKQRVAEQTPPPAPTKAKRVPEPWTHNGRPRAKPVTDEAMKVWWQRKLSKPGDPGT